MNGSTATEGGLGALSTGALSASANAEAVPKRSAGILASAFMSASSTAGGTAARTRRILGTGSVNRFEITICALAPV
jgi:hypothetical protein